MERELQGGIINAIDHQSFRLKTRLKLEVERLHPLQCDRRLLQRLLRNISLSPVAPGDRRCQRSSFPDVHGALSLPDFEHGGAKTGS